MGPFDRFNDRAKRVLALAQDEAIRMKHDHLGVEHLLVGLVREGEGVAARTLNKLGVDLGRTREAVMDAVPATVDATPSEIRLTPRMKRVVELANDEARRLGSGAVGTEHLLLGLVGEGESVATGVLASFGVALEKVRADVIAAVGERDERGAAAGFWVDAKGNKRDWFCEDVLAKKLEVRVLYEDERALGFEHPYPYYRVHGVVIPKAHVAGVLAPEALDAELLLSMLRGVQAVAAALGLDKKGFRVEANAAAPGVTPHMHWHVAGPGLPPAQR